MKFGHFDDARKEYVITTPRTPLPWINYLGSEDFFSLVSNTAGGYSFYRDARMRRLTRYRYNSSPLDMDGHHIYIKDGDTVWNPGWQPAKTELDRYTCRHGLGYSVIEGQKNGVSAAQTLLVPQGDNCLLIRLTLKNETAAEKTLDVFPYVEFCLWDAMDDGSNFQRNFSIGEVELEPDAIYHKSEYRERRNHYAVFWANRPYDGFDTARDAFIGLYGAPSLPEAVQNGRCTNSVVHGWAPVGAMQFHMALRPGESRELFFGLGYVENPEDDDEVREYLRRILRKQAGDGSGLIYGMGHAVYTISDPREVILKQRARHLAYEKGFEEEYNMLCSIERLAPGIFAEEKGSTKPVCANVDLFSGLIYNMLGISEDLYTPLFAIARVPGWCAHRVEEVVFANRIIRPAYKYLGVRQKYKPIEER